MGLQSVSQAAQRSALDAQAVLRKEHADGKAGLKLWRSLRLLAPGMLEANILA
jgi:hypothetical protein